MLSNKFTQIAHPEASDQSLARMTVTPKEVFESAYGSNFRDILLKIQKAQFDNRGPDDPRKYMYVPDYSDDFMNSKIDLIPYQDDGLSTLAYVNTKEPTQINVRGDLWGANELSELGNANSLKASILSDGSIDYLGEINRLNKLDEARLSGTSEILDRFSNSPLERNLQTIIHEITHNAQLGEHAATNRRFKNIGSEEYEVVEPEPKTPADAVPNGWKPSFAMTGYPVSEVELPAHISPLKFEYFNKTGKYPQVESAEEMKSIINKLLKDRRESRSVNLNELDVLDLLFKMPDHGMRFWNSVVRRNDGLDGLLA